MADTPILEKLPLPGDTGEYIALVTLGREEDDGRLTAELCRSLSAVLDTASVDSLCRAAVLTNRGSAFCMGARLIPDENGMPDIPGFMAAFGTLHAALDSFGKPLLLAVNGKTGGGGMTLAAAADMVFANAEAVFSLPEIKAGSVPGFALRKLKDQLPQKVLYELAYTGEGRTAFELSRYGFVTPLRPEDDVVQHTVDAAKALASHSAAALRSIRETMHSL